MPLEERPLHVLVLRCASSGAGHPVSVRLATHAPHDSIFQQARLYGMSCPLCREGMAVVYDGLDRAQPS